MLDIQNEFENKIKSKYKCVIIKPMFKPKLVKII